MNFLHFKSQNKPNPTSDWDVQYHKYQRREKLLWLNKILVIDGIVTVRTVGKIIFDSRYCEYL